MSQGPSVWGLVPLKPFAEAKARLGPALPPAGRAALAQRMAEHVLAVLGRVLPCAVVTPCADVGRFAEARGALVVREAAAAGLNAALRRGTSALAARGADAVLILPGDLPGLEEGDVRRLLAAYRPDGVALAPAAADGGTNALLLRLPAPIPFRFGPNSAQRHRAAAEAAGLRADVLHLPSLARDVDVPADLAGLAATG